MREFRIRLIDAAFDALVDVALRERRAPREQAAYLLEHRLQEIAEARPPAVVAPVHTAGPLRVQV